MLEKRIQSLEEPRDDLKRWVKKLQGNFNKKADIKGICSCNDFRVQANDSIRRSHYQEDIH